MRGFFFPLWEARKAWEGENGECNDGEEVFLETGNEDEGDEDEGNEDEGDEDEGMRTKGMKTKEMKETAEVFPFLSIDNPPDIGASAP